MTLNGISIGLVMCGDKKRFALCHRLLEVYRTYAWLDESTLLYNKNPAISFNQGATRLTTDIFVGIAGDVYIGEDELKRFILTDGHVVFAANSYLSIHLKKQTRLFMAWWSETRYEPFISGLFRCKRTLLLDEPFQESPSFFEDALWQRYMKDARPNVEFVGVHVPIVHIDIKKVIPRFRDVQAAVLFPHLFKSRTFMGRMMEMTAWRIPIEWRQRDYGEQHAKDRGPFRDGQEDDFT